MYQKVVFIYGIFYKKYKMTQNMPVLMANKCYYVAYFVSGYIGEF